MLITEAYRELNARKHEQSATYGSYGHELVEQVRKLAREIPAHTILDYGCGKRTLEKALGYAICNYDPAIPGCEASPAPADLVVCCDVLEHVELECVDDVLNDLQRVTLHTGLFIIDCKLANKHLPDGRNTHLIVEKPEWWMRKLLDRFDLRKIISSGESLMALVRKQSPTRQ